MAKFIYLTCFRCGKEIVKPLKEYTRQKRKNPNHRFFCGFSCARTQGNDEKPDQTYQITRNCAYCGKEFVTSSKAKEINVVHCSRACASANSMTDLRRETARRVGKEAIAKNTHPFLEKNHLGMRKREAYKNVLLRSFFEKHKIDHVFEHKIGKHIYDLFVPALKMVVEFDGPNHQQSQQRKVDSIKNQVAMSAGLSIFRISVGSKEVIPAEKIIGIIYPDYII